ncbi:MAG: PQQ-dependent sugar dehydrogenase, partial [Actinomycetota bacterium]
PNLTTTLVARGLDDPVDLATPPGETRRLFVVEQVGRIRIVRDGAVVGTPFLDIVSRVGSGGERGLLGLAFHPQYAQTGRFFVNYTDRRGDTHISEFRVTSNADLADPATERQLMFVAQPFANHTGGGLAFGNDGMLYIALGDGGSGGDPMRNGQNRGTRLGKILRIDVDRGNPFGIPSDNPFASTAGVLPEIWAYGLRNPWRISIDRSTGDLYIGDVGQGRREEVDVGFASRRGGENYGWIVMEGTLCFSPGAGCNTSGLTQPVLDYPIDGAASECAVTGGFVYRGCRMPGYHGTYFYGDYCTGLVRSLRVVNAAAADERDWTAILRRTGGGAMQGLSSFGVDGKGELYLVLLGGEVYRLARKP